jgi:hypothetical protein
MKRQTRLLTMLLGGAILVGSVAAPGSGVSRNRDQLAVAMYGSDAVVVGTLTRITEAVQDDVEYRRGLLEVDEVLVPSDTTMELMELQWPRHLDMDHKPHLGNRGIWLLKRPKGGGSFKARANGWLSLDYRDTIQVFVDFGITMAVPNPDTPPPEIILELTVRNLTTDPKEFPGLSITDGFVSADPRLRFTVRAGALEYPPGSRLVYDEAVPPLKLAPGEAVTFDLPVGRIWRLAGISRYELRFECDGVALIPRIGIRGEGTGVGSLPVGYVER